MPLDQEKLYTALMLAFTQAINKVGLPAFKATSMFGSSDRFRTGDESYSGELTKKQVDLVYQLADDRWRKR